MMKKTDERRMLGIGFIHTVQFIGAHMFFLCLLNIIPICNVFVKMISATERDLKLALSLYGEVVYMYDCA